MQSNLDYVYKQLVWGLVPDRPMIIGIWADDAAKKRGDDPVMTLFIGEAMENAGRKHVMKHVAECDKSPWLPNWNPAKKTFNAIKHSRK